MLFKTVWNVVGGRWTRRGGVAE